MRQRGGSRFVKLAKPNPNFCDTGIYTPMDGAKIPSRNPKLKKRLRFTLSYTHELRHITRPLPVIISYTRDPDQPIARALREGLQRFGRAAFARRLLRVFLDEAILDAGGELPGRISEAIRQSSYLIVLASPQSRTRRWVNSEISEFLGTHGPDRILICLTAGEIAWDADRNVFDSQTNEPILACEILGLGIVRK
jgi:TIR domain